jgi:hypothetical protein
MLVVVLRRLPAVRASKKRPVNLTLRDVINDKTRGPPNTTWSTKFLLPTTVSLIATSRTAE